MHEGGASEPIGSPSPVRVGERIGALDVYRGLAVLTILLMNMDAFALPVDAVLGSQLCIGVRSWIDAWTYGVLTLCFEGTARGSFGLLFGASVILLTTRLESRGDQAADIHFRRNLWLMVFGLAHSFALLWIFDVLFYYGFTGLFLFVFRKARPSLLFLYAAVALLPLLVVPALRVADHYDIQERAIVLAERSSQGETLTSQEQTTLDRWTRWSKNKPDEHEYPAYLERYSGGYTDIWLAQRADVVHWHTRVLYRYMFWDGAVFMLIGMGLFKAGVLTLERSTRFYVLMACACYAVALPVRGLNLWIELSQFEHGAIESWHGLLYHPGRIPMTLGHAATAMLLVRFFGRGLFAYLLAACGRMALTNYVAQTVICTWLFWGFGLGLYNRVPRLGLLGICVGIFTLQLVWSPLWLALFRFGPLEWAWRSLTYWKLQSILRERAVPAQTPPPTAPT